MKKIIVLFFLLFLVSCTKDAPKTFVTEALKAKLIAVNGSELSFEKIINSHKGNTIVIEIWASWCADCIKSIPELKKLQAQHPATSYISLSVDHDNPNWIAAIKKHKLSGDHYRVFDQMDGTFGKAVDLHWIPRYIVLDKTGKIILYNENETHFDTIDTTLTFLEKSRE